MASGYPYFCIQLESGRQVSFLSNRKLTANWRNFCYRICTGEMNEFEDIFRRIPGYGGADDLEGYGKVQSEEEFLRLVRRRRRLVRREDEDDEEDGENDDEEEDGEEDEDDEEEDISEDEEGDDEEEDEDGNDPDYGHPYLVDVTIPMTIHEGHMQWSELGDVSPTLLHISSKRVVLMWEAGNEQ